MTFKEYSDQINAFLKANPEVADYTAVSSADDEGNRFNPVYYSPSAGHYSNGEFKTGEDLKGLSSEEKPNVVCIN